MDSSENNKTVSFSNFDLAQPIVESLNQLGYTNPTKVQELTIPISLQGTDVLASAETGSGKTMAFLLPMLSKIINNKDLHGIVLLPTRELAIQVLDVAKQLLKQTPYIKSSLLIGGDSIDKQLKQLKYNPKLIIGTPGRINDHLKRKSLNLSKFNFLVLDETDRMMDMGFGIQIDSIIKCLPTNRQTFMFTATLPKNIINMANKYLKQPKLIELAKNKTAAIKITQNFIHLSEAEKYKTLILELNNRTSGSVIIFAKTKRKTEQLSKLLSKDGYSVDFIHGDLKQNKRKHIIQKFRDNGYQIMVATDVVARGLDIPHIEHVINYDLPQSPEDYTHRIGRTGRAGSNGSSVCFVAKEEQKEWRALQKYLNPDLKIKIPSGSTSSSRNGGNKRFKGRSYGSNSNSRTNNNKKRFFTPKARSL